MSPSDPSRAQRAPREGAIFEQPGGFPRIDSHQHFTREYLPSLLFPILKRNRFDASVVVANVPSVEETRWLLGLAAEHDFIRAVVGWADLADPRVGQVLDEYQRHPKFRGVCYWFAGQLPPGLGELERRDLTLDVGAGFTPALAEGFPRLRVAIDHMGTRRGAAAPSLALYPSVYAKISGLITEAPTQWKAAEFQPAVRQALAAFGPERVMYGSDWPSYLPLGTWKEALAAFTQAIGPQTMETREQLLGGTARRFYRIEAGDAA
ncbi:MAG: amidohydrolase family protein [Candidatus Solibacter sp.]|nr:amidohydrolase family protein [Candidatus Solibacter sp.]